MIDIKESLTRRSAVFFIVLGLTLVLVLGFLDYLTGPEISFSIFYLIPISLVAWFSKRRIGILISFVSAVSWFTADLVTGHTYSHPVIPYWNATARLDFFLVLTYSLASLKDALERERELARTDYLTGIANSRSFYESANAELNRIHRYKHPFTFAYLDLDNFKTVNDRFGHGIGDVLLRFVAETIKNSIRITDKISRLAGDEFAILLPETGFDAAQIVISKVQENL
jgi:predicted signal transduction protein with EAL and GGDEF domain